jgi:large subunit ribosomal protein L13
MITKTFQPKAGDIKRTWHLLDASHQVLGRLSTQAATLLMGKNKVTYAAHLDLGDHVVVINAKAVDLTGNKESDKKYYHHSGYPGGLKVTTAANLRQAHPERLIIHSVSGMLPKNKLRDPRLARLHVFPGAEHPYGRQVGK